MPTSSNRAGRFAPEGWCISCRTRCIGASSPFRETCTLLARLPASPMHDADPESWNTPHVRLASPGRANRTCQTVKMNNSNIIGRSNRMVCMPFRSCDSMVDGRNVGTFFFAFPKPPYNNSTAKQNHPHPITTSFPRYTWLQRY